MDTLVLRNQVRLARAGVRAIVDAAEARAAEIGVPECIAVVDDGGSLLGFARMDGARPGSNAIALTKAVSAATRRRSTAEEGGGDGMSGLRLALAGERITQIGGGFPIVVEGQVIGGIGVSSGTSDEDIAVAQAGLSALAAALG